MNMNYKKRLSIITVCLTLLAFLPAKAQTSQQLEPMAELVELYEQLNQAFPYSDYVTMNPDEVHFWVNRNMMPEYDFVGIMEKIKPTIERLKSLPHIGNAIYRENTPAEGVEYACHPSHNDDVQENYVELLFSRNMIHFYYTSKKKASTFTHQTRQQIADEMEELVQQYISRPNVKTRDIMFDGPTYQYQLVTFNNPQQIRQHAEGTIYTVPNTNQEDWLRFFNKIRDYAIHEHVQVAWNDVYRDHEAVEILIDRDSTIPIVYAATWKDGELTLLRLEGTEGFNIILPRIWSEDSPIFDPKRNKDYIQP